MQTAAIVYQEQLTTTFKQNTSNVAILFLGRRLAQSDDLGTKSVTFEVFCLNVVVSCS